MQTFPAVRPTLMLVDDSPDNLRQLDGLLRGRFTVKAFSHGRQALAFLTELTLPSMVLLDVTMPDIDGYEVCRRIKANPVTEKIPVIFITGKTDHFSERLGMDLGAVDYISRPVEPAILLSRVNAHLVQASVTRTLQISNEYLEYEISRRRRELQEHQDIAIMALATLAETRDTDTGLHIKRTQQYVRALALRLQRHPKFTRFLTDDTVEILFKTAPLHDIGKIGIPDRILLKPGRLDEEELRVMRQHPYLGYCALQKAQASIDHPVEFLEVAKTIIYSHHEKWDGSGYPQGLIGENIPIPARLMAVADVYDALICRRVYKSGMSHEQAAEIIYQGRGNHFDPDVVDAFVDSSTQFHSIAERLADQVSGGEG